MRTAPGRAAAAPRLMARISDCTDVTAVLVMVA